MIKNIMRSSRRIDIRQVFAAMLTLSMFAMLGNMIKRDHFDYVEVKYPARSTIQVQSLKITGKNSINENKQELMMPPQPPSRSSVVDDVMLRFNQINKKQAVVKPCWNMSSTLFKNEKKRKPEGSVAFSLTNAPEYHASQVANAVVMAKYLGASLVLPDIIMGTKHNATRNFSEIYDDRKFFDNLKGVVQVVQNGHDKTSEEAITIVHVPNMVSEAYIEARVKHVFERTKNLHMSTYFPSINTKNGDGVGPAGHLDPVTCLAMFETLRFQPQVRDMFENTVRTLRMFRQGSNVRLVSIDLRDEISGRRSCEEGKMNVCGAAEIGEFLRRVGFGAETAIYVTRSRWDEDLDQLRKIFPRTYTKDLLMESDSRLKRWFLDNGNGELDRVLDLYMCSESDVYVPTNSEDVFSTNVVGNRIASGRSWVLVPAKIDASSSNSPSASEYMSPYISKRTHWAYSCFCQDGTA